MKLRPYQNYLGIFCCTMSPRVVAILFSIVLLCVSFYAPSVTEGSSELDEPRLGLIFFLLGRAEQSPRHCSAFSTLMGVDPGGDASENSAQCSDVGGTACLESRETLLTFSPASPNSSGDLPKTGGVSNFPRRSMNLSYSASCWPSLLWLSSFI